MEVTTVSPSPALPTEGDDLCEIDVTNVAIHSVTLLICLCGLVGNGAVLCLLRLKLRNTVICRLALADFIVMVFTVISTLLFLLEDMSCSLIMPLLYLRFLFLLSVASCFWALFWLMLRSNMVCIHKLCKLCCHCDLPKHQLLWVVCVQFSVFSVVFTAIYALCPSHQQEQCRAALISMYALILLLLVAPMAISSTIDFIKAKRGSKKLKPKRCSIVVFLIVLFILLLIISNFLHHLGYTVMSSDVLFLLNCIQSSIKPFICCLAGRCWRPCSLRSLRLSLQRVFDEQKEETAHSNDAPMDTGV